MADGTAETDEGSTFKGTKRSPRIEATADKWMRMHANGEPFDPDLGVGVSFARFDFAHRKQGKTQIAAEVGARH